MQDAMVTTTIKGPSIIVVNATLDGHVNVKIEIPSPVASFPTAISTDVPVENIDGLVEALLAQKGRALAIRNNASKEQS